MTCAKAEGDQPTFWKSWTMVSLSGKPMERLKKQSAEKNWKVVRAMVRCVKTGRKEEKAVGDVEIWRMSKPLCNAWHVH